MIRVLFGKVAMLASFMVAPAGLAPLAFPIWPVVLLIATAPTWMIFAYYILRLPFSHALTRAKVVFVNLCIAAIEFLATPITGNGLTSSSSRDLTTLRTASDGLGTHPLPTFEVEFLTTDWAGCQFDLLSSIGTLTTPRAKKHTAFAPLNVAGVFVYLFAAIFAVDYLSHTWIIT